MDIKVNDCYEVKCVDLNHQAEGVVKIDGFLVFVEGLLEGETAKIKIIKKSKSFAIGKIVKRLTNSDFRTEALCPSYDKCGGCNLMHLLYEKQLEFKEKKVNETLKKIGHLSDVKVDKVIGMVEPKFYRNKVQIPFTTINNKTVCGFYQRGTHKISELGDCFIQPSLATKIAKKIADLANYYGIKGYNEADDSGILRHVLIRKNVFEEFMVVIITRKKKAMNINMLVENLVEEFPSIVSVIQNINPLKTNVILGEEEKVLFGKEFIVDEICGKKFNVSSQSFFQTNHVQTEKLYNEVILLASPQKDEIICDAYCGVGTIGIILSDFVREVYGIEIVPSAITDANENAKNNDVKNIKFILGKSEEKILELDQINIDTIIVDPPRKGCNVELLNAIISKKIKKVVYVSCNVATLARDLEILSSDYKVSKVHIVDMFPHTSEIETIVLLTSKIL